jgi:predicted DNA-binding transcriptional regulator YafY
MGTSGSGKNVSDLHRLLRIITMVQSGTELDHVGMAAELGVGERTLYRDLSKIKEVGIGIDFDRKRGRFVMRGQALMQPLQLDGEEAMALAALCREVAATEQIAFTKPAARAMSKVMAQLPEGMRQEVEETTKRMVIQMERGGAADGYADVFEAVQLAIIEQRALECEYESARKGEGEPFVFHPYSLFYSVRAWYVVGYHAGRGEVRSLKLSRFVRLDAMEKRYEVPSSFTLEGYLGNAWRMIRGERDYRVELEFDESIAETISETNWHRTQEIEYLDGGRLRFRCTVSGLDEIVWWVMSMGPSCRVVGPVELVEKVKGLAARVVGMYGEG